MSAEPVWPTVDEVIEQTHGDRPKYFCDQAAATAIDMCRAAWLAANDDPAASPAGEVRRTPSGRAVVKYSVTSGANWIQVGIRTTTMRDSDVKGWPVIGAVPGSPAAEADRG